MIAALRRTAYARPTWDPAHWMLLLVADRLEVGRALVRELARPGGAPLVVRHYARQARSFPRGTAALLAGALALAAIARPRR